MYTSYRDCCSHYHGCPPPCVYVPVVWVPVQPACCDSTVIPRDLDADPTHASQTTLVGGSTQVSLSLEYLVETGAVSPSVTLTTTSDGATATWSDTTPAVGYHVQEGLLSVKAGTKVSLKVNNVTARLRWCERICC
jgi:hypothetical protein